MIVVYNTLQNMHLQLQERYGDDLCLLSKELTREMISHSGDPKDGVLIIIVSALICAYFVNYYSVTVTA